MIFGLAALVTAALFTGAAFYINFAEQPARLALGEQQLLVQWKRAYKRGFVMQASIAIISAVLGMIALWRTGDLRWSFGAALIIANWPYTLIAMMPTNNRLDATPPELADAQTRALIAKWGGLHAVRTILGAAATAAFLWAAA